MTALSPSLVLSALNLPPHSLVEQRIPKKTLIEQATPSSADKKLINESIEELNWYAVLKPTTIGIAAYQDETREYSEIAVLHLTTRGQAKVQRLNELLHRAIPYPLLILTSQQTQLSLSLAHKRRSISLIEQQVCEELNCQSLTENSLPFETTQVFLESLSLTQINAANLAALYQTWWECLACWELALLTGSYQLLTTDKLAMAREQAAKWQAIQQHVQSLRVQARKERQVHRQVELNLKIKSSTAECAALLDSIQQTIQGA